MALFGGERSPRISRSDLLKAYMNRGNPDYTGPKVDFTPKKLRGELKPKRREIK